MPAPKELSFNLGIGAAFTGSIQDQEVAAEMYRIYNALNTLASKLDEYSGALSANVADRAYLPSSYTVKIGGITRLYKQTASALAVGTVVNIFSGGCRAALHGSFKAHAIVLEDTAAGNYAPVALMAVLPGFVALTPGADYFLSNSTPGAITGAGGTQKVGFAVSPTELAFGFFI